MPILIKRSKGILGMNARNLEYIRPFNRRGAVNLADSKLRSKEAFYKAGIPVSKVYGIVRNRHELENFRWADLPKSFVLKPNRGRGGEGIKIIYGQKKDLRWISTEGEAVTIKDLQNHILNIFDGFYSLAGIPDIAFFEERIKLSKNFKPYSYKGIPDIRVIVFNKVPVMAMLRLPTKESGGKANLHLGGVGVGIDIATGITTHAIMHDQPIEKTPDTKLALRGIKIPFWREILEIAIKCQQVAKLGYIGVDVAFDRERGPVVLEVNARPGLSIQNANLAPLKYRLQKVKGLKVKSEAHGIRIAQDLFGGEIQQEIEDISGKRILGIIETIRIKHVGEGKPAETELKAKIDTGADLSSIDKNLVKELGYADVIDEFDESIKSLSVDKNAVKEKLDEQIKDKLQKWGESFDTVVIKSSHGVSYRLVIKLDIILAGTEIISKMSITDRSYLEFPVIIGRKDLKKFLVDPSKSQISLIPELNSIVISKVKRGNVGSIIEAINEAEKYSMPENESAKKKIILYAVEIDKVAGEFNDIYSFITPFGSEGESYNLEMKNFIEKRSDEKYNPKFEYPILNNFRVDRFETVLDSLSVILKKAKLEDNEFVKTIIMEAIILMQDKISFLLAVRKKDEFKSFEFAKRIYGDINDDLVKKAEEIYKKLVSSGEKKSEENEMLENKIFGPKDIGNRLQEILDKMGISGWDVVLDEESNQIDVKFNSAKYAKPTIVIPRERRMNGINLLKTIIHEIVHVKTNSNNREAGFGGVIFGRDYELYQEGMARIMANEFSNEILGVEKELPYPYYIMAMDKIKKGYGYHRVFDYIYGLKLEEYKVQKTGKDYDAEKASLKEAILVCRRVFRGFRNSLSGGGAYFPKDKMYLEGEILAKKIYDASLGNYLIAAKIDPYLLPSFIKLGVIRKERIKYKLEKDLEIYRKYFLKL